MVLVKGPTPFLYSWISIFLSTICWKDSPFPMERFRHPLQIMWGFISGLSVLFIHISFFMPVSHCCDYSSFVIIFDIRKGETSNFVLFLFKVILAVWSFYDAIWIFSILWEENTWDFVRNCLKSVDPLWVALTS